MAQPRTALTDMPSAAPAAPRIKVDETLTTLCRLTEEHINFSMCSILLVSPEGNKLVAGVGPSLPQDYAAALDGLEISACAGSCGTSAYYGEQIIVRDIQTDPLWEPFKELAARYGIRACWSTPIIDSAGTILGTFAVSHREPKSPTGRELELIEMAVRLAAITLQHSQMLVELENARNQLEERVLERTAALTAANDKLQHEVNERRRAQESLRESESLLGHISDHVPALLSYMDTDLRYRYASKKYLDWFGMSPDEVVGKHLSEVVGFSAYAKVRPRIEAVLAGETVSFELEVNYRYGGPRWVAATYTPSFAGGEVVGYHSLVTDITVLKEAENERLTHAKRQRDALVREVHHRIKNTLQGVAGLLSDYGRTHPELETGLNTAITQVKAVAVVHGLQADGRPTVALDSLVTSIVDNAVCPESVSVEVHDEESKETVAVVSEGEAVPIALVMNELLTNAIKHCRLAPSGITVVNVEMSIDGECFSIRIGNPGELPVGFDFATGEGLGIGLGLVHSLLPSQGVCLDFRSDNGRVTIVLTLQPPVVTSFPSVT